MYAFSYVALIQCHSKNIDVEGSRLVKVDTVRAASTASVMEYPGSVKPRREVKLAFRVAGPIASFDVEKGQLVRKGEVIAHIDARDYEIQLAATKAEYEQVKSEAQRIIEMYNRKSVSENDYDKAVSGLNQISAKYEAHKNALSDTRLLAPFDGFIQNMYYQKDETVAIGMPVVSIISRYQLIVDVDLPVKDYLNRSQFDRFYCLSDIYPNKRFPLKYLEIVHQGNQNQLYRLSLSIDENESAALAAGMSVSVLVELKRSGNAESIVPITALFYNQDKTFVWRFDPATSQVLAVAVSVGKVDTNGMVVVHDGVHDGDIVVTGGVHHLTSGQRVRVLPAVSKSNVGGLL